MDVYTGKDVGQLVRRKAKYGHRDWLFWKDRNGEPCAALCTKDSIKAAMLASGTQGVFLLYSRYGGSMLGSWSLGALWLRNARWLGY